MRIFSHFARWEFFPAGLFSHGKKFLWDFSKIVSVAQMSCNCDLDSIICIVAFAHQLYTKYHIDGALQTEMRQQIACER